MHIERDRRQLLRDACRSPDRGVVDALLMNDRDLWVVVARHGEQIEEWLHGMDGEEVAPLRVCRTLLANGEIVIGKADPDRDLLLSELQDIY